MPLTPEEEADLKRYMEKEAAKGNDPLAKIERQADLAEFREKYSVDKPSPLVCPDCTMGFNIGRLYKMEGYENTFVCRTCKLVFEINCKTITTDELIEKHLEARRLRREAKKAEKGEK